MIRMIRQFLSVILIVTSCVLVMVLFAQSDPAQDQSAQEAPSEMEVGLVIRESIGLGRSDVVPASAGDQEHQQLIAAAIDYSSADVSADLSPLAANYREAQDSLVEAITWGEDVDQAYETVTNARTALATAAQPLQLTLIAGLPPTDGASVALVQQNLELDPDLRTLVLTDDQRQEIIEAQRERDKVLLDARNWYADDKRAEATDVFEEALESILSQEQYATVQTNRELLESRMFEMATAEVAPFEAADDDGSPP